MRTLKFAPRTWLLFCDNLRIMSRNIRIMAAAAIAATFVVVVFLNTHERDVTGRVRVEALKASCVKRVTDMRQLIQMLRQLQVSQETDPECQMAWEVFQNIFEVSVSTETHLEVPEEMQETAMNWVGGDQDLYSQLINPTILTMTNKWTLETVGWNPLRGSKPQPNDNKQQEQEMVEKLMRNTSGFKNCDFCAKHRTAMPAGIGRLENVQHDVYTASNAFTYFDDVGIVIPRKFHDFRDIDWPNVWLPFLMTLWYDGSSLSTRLNPTWRILTSFGTLLKRAVPVRFTHTFNFGLEATITWAKWGPCPKLPNDTRCITREITLKTLSWLTHCSDSHWAFKMRSLLLLWWPSWTTNSSSWIWLKNLKTVFWAETSSKPTISFAKPSRRNSRSIAPAQPWLCHQCQTQGATICQPLPGLEAEAKIASAPSVTSALWTFILLMRSAQTCLLTWRHWKVPEVVVHELLRSVQFVQRVFADIG